MFTVLSVLRETLFHSSGAADPSSLLNNCKVFTINCFPYLLFKDSSTSSRDGNQLCFYNMSLHVWAKKFTFFWDNLGQLGATTDIHDGIALF